ncbi:MAG: hypothetical protein IT169_11040 [Bryobacterales bacterium]|nr:hypothetical protein [Bryobacterales bacterium]
MTKRHRIPAIAPPGACTRRQWLGLAVAAAAGANACAHKKPRVVYVNSYHRGYAPGDAVAQAVRERLATAGLEPQTLYLDGARHPAALPQAAQGANAVIRISRPDVVLVSGEFAMRHLVVPFLRAGPIPVLFSGVEWTADPYEVPNKYVTGMVEAPPVEETIALVKMRAPGIRNLFVLSADTPLERRNHRFLDPVYWKSGLSTTYGLVSDFEHWKRAFLWANRNTDVVFFVTNTGIRHWDEEAAVEHIREHIRVPVFCCNASMIRYCVAGRVNVDREPGEWMAGQALRILAGTKPEEIPLARNKQSRVVGNSEFAARLRFPLPPDAVLYP